MRWGLLTTARLMAADDGANGGSQAAEVLVETPSPEQPAQAVDPIVTDTAEPEPEPQADPKPKRSERHIASLTRKAAEETRLREVAERRADAAEALLRAKDPEAKPAARETPDDIETRVAREIENRAFSQRLTDIDTQGRKEFGDKNWHESRLILTEAGAATNQTFLQALAEAENPAKLFAHFAGDTDALEELLARPPAAMAARIGRLDAQMSKPAAAPTLSAAPKPAAKIVTAGVAPEPDPYNYPPDMSMKDWNKMMAPHLPASLGGKKKVA